MTFLRGMMASLILSVATVAIQAQAQQPRDSVTKPAAGTALLGGVVTSQDDSAHPLRRVLVTLSGTGVLGSLQVTTDDSGRFAFTELPAGRYTITAEKPAYVKMYYGSKRVGRGPGMPIALAEGQRVTDLAVTLLRGAVIEGTVLDENGVPISSAQVQVYQPVVVNGERKLVNPPGSQPWATTDDRGIYRLYGLAPGEYTVRAGGGGSLRDARLTTTAEINAALQELRGTPSGTTPEVSSAGPPLVARSGAYFPGVTDAALSEFFTLVAGQERAGVDVRSPLVHPTRLEGTAVGPSGQPLRSVMIGMANASTGSMWTSLGGIQAREDGRFSVPSVTPGRYLFFGRGTESGAVGNPSLLPLWTSAEVTVNEQDFLDLVLQFLPGTAVSGRIGVRDSQSAPDATKLRLTLAAVPAIAGTAVSSPPMSPQADGSFVFTGVAPGKYRLSMAGGGSWSLRSATVNGRDTLDQPLDVQPGQDVSNIAVTLTDRPGEISGTLFDQLGRPSPEFAVVMFSTDRAYWTTAPRRMSGVRAGSDGRFSVTGLPPGAYFLTAVTDLDPSQLADPSFLEQLATTAIRITLGEGEKKVQDLTLR